MMVFQPGNKMGQGRPKLDPYLVEVKKMNRDEVERIIAELMKGTRSNLKAIIDDQEAPMFQLMVASLIHKAVTTGDVSILNFLLDRTIGKVKEIDPVDTERRDKEWRHDDALGVIPREEIVKLIRLKSGNAGE